MNQIDRNRTLFICTSPLQAALTLNLIKLKSLFADVIYLSSNYDLRSKYYIEILRKHCHKVFLIKVNNRKAWHVLIIIELLLARNKVFNGVYIASFNSFYAAYILNRLKVVSINIYDDGIFSLFDEKNRASYYYQLSDRLILKIIFKFLGIKKINQDIVNEAEYFYTIYPEHQQLVTSEKAIGVKFLLSSNVQTICPIFKNINIFIGDVIDELSNERRLLYSKIINNDLIDYYIPHPRNNKFNLYKNKILSIHTVAEEFIINMLEAKFTVNIISFGSSVLFNVPYHKELNKFIVKQPEYSIPNLYKIAENYDIIFINENDLSERLSVARD